MKIAAVDASIGNEQGIRFSWDPKRFTGEQPAATEGGTMFIHLFSEVISIYTNVEITSSCIPGSLYSALPMKVSRKDFSIQNMQCGSCHGRLQ